MAKGDPLIDAALRERRLRIYKGDLADFKSLKAALAAIKAGETKIDVLFNNAGIGLGGIFFSPQGREMHFEVNTVAPYVILQELKALLARGDECITKTGWYGDVIGDAQLLERSGQALAAGVMIGNPFTDAPEL